MKCYYCVMLFPNDPEKQLESVEGKYFCCREHKIEWNKAQNNRPMNQERKKLPFDAMMARLREMQAVQRAKEAQEAKDNEIARIFS